MGLNQLLTILTELCDQCWSKLQIVDLEDKTSIQNFSHRYIFQQGFRFPVWRFRIFNFAQNLTRQKTIIGRFTNCF